MRLKLDKQNTGRILEMLYLLVFAAFIAWSFLNTTKFEIVWPNYFYSDLKALLLLVIIVKAGYMGNYSKSDILSVFLIGAVILLNVSRNGYTELEILLLLIWFIMYLVFLQMKNIKRGKRNSGITGPIALMWRPEI